MERIQFQARITSNNQITIPEEVREIEDLRIRDILTLDLISVNHKNTEKTKQ